MGLFGKLKEILFDEETVEIPVITKDEKSEFKDEKKSNKNVELTPLPTKSNRVQNDDEVIIKKIETPKRAEKSRDFVTYGDEDLFDDMPKLKESNTYLKEELPKKPKTFTFPVYDDDEPKEIKITSKTRSQAEEMDINKIEAKSEQTKKETPKIREQKPSGYTNAFDYSYGKYKGDYKSSRESNSSVLKNTLEQKEERKAFSPSPIISPVYGVLNENYKKEDIISKSEKPKTSRVLDLDSVRRKAYGTLEDEIEVSLTKAPEDEPLEEFNDEPEILNDDEGLSINDLLVDQDEENSEFSIEEVGNDELLYSKDEDVIKEEIELDYEDEPTPKVKQKKTAISKSDDKFDKEEKEALAKRAKTYSDEVLESVKGESEDKSDTLGEEDLFDLIDSLYQGKDDE